MGLGEAVEDGFRPLSNSPTKWGLCAGFYSRAISIERAVRLSSPRHWKERAPCIGRRSPCQTGVWRDPMHTPARSAQLLHKGGLRLILGSQADSVDAVRQ